MRIFDKCERGQTLRCILIPGILSLHLREYSSKAAGAVARHYRSSRTAQGPPMICINSHENHAAEKDTEKSIYI